MQRRGRKFTLVELLVSLGVFSILLILFMQIFSNMRLAWTNTEKRNDSFGEVRAAMDVMTTLLSAVYYSANSTVKGDVAGVDQTGHYPFLLDQTNGRPGRLYFATNTPYNLPGTNPIRFVAFLVQKNGGDTVAENYTEMSNNLYLTVYSNLNAEYYRFFPNFIKKDDGGNLTEVACSVARDDLVVLLNDGLKDSSRRLKLLDNVIDFKVKGYGVVKDAGGTTSEDGRLFTDNEVKCVPREIEISLTVMTKEDLAKYNEMTDAEAKKEFRLKNQMSFSRRVFIGDRMMLEVKDE